MDMVRAAYWLQSGGMPVENINPDPFTHLFCAFAHLDRTTNKVVVNPDPFSRFSDVLHTKNPALKTLLSIGGVGGNFAEEFAFMARSPNSRKSFIESSIQVAREHRFDGLDLHYECPDNQTDKTNLSMLLQEWKAAVDNESRTTNRPRLLLTAAIRYTENYIPYPTEDIANNLDWINAMAYDLRVPPTNPQGCTTAPTAALRDNSNSPVSGHNFVDALVGAKVPTHMIVLGIPFYGYGWTLANGNSHGYGAPATGPATFTADGTTSALVTYRQIKEFIRTNRAVTEYDSTRVGNYCYHGTTWISYDDEDAVNAKVKYAIKERKLRGYFAWQLAGDDDAFTLSSAAAAAAAPSA